MSIRLTLGYTDSNIRVNKATRKRGDLTYDDLYDNERMHFHIEGLPSMWNVSYTEVNTEAGDTFDSLAALKAYLDTSNFFDPAPGDGGTAAKIDLFTTNESGNFTGLEGKDVLGVVGSGIGMIKGTDFTKGVSDDSLAFVDGALPPDTVLLMVYKTP